MIGDAYMVLAGGPIPSRLDVHHVESITNYGLGILEATKHILDPSTSKHLRIRVGTGAGVQWNPSLRTPLKLGHLSNKDLFFAKEQFLHAPEIRTPH